FKIQLTIIILFIVCTFYTGSSQTIDSIAIISNGTSDSLYYSGHRLGGQYIYKTDLFFQNDTLMVFSKYVLLSSFGDNKRYDTIFALNDTFDPDIHNRYLKSFDSVHLYN